MRRLSGYIKCCRHKFFERFIKNPPHPQIRMCRCVRYMFVNFNLKFQHFKFLPLIPVAACLLRLWVRFLPAAWMSVCCECYVLSRRGIRDELVTCPEESYRPWCVIVCDLETS